ncbi:MAG: SDR family oxidoreductase [Candidatus Omnitrophica bacterium]|jgi:nucleoside-diphosphate-sugar epimerase|nr:SDR family oxidoreductase [Candidatus Omnitrophota bacterium]
MNILVTGSKGYIGSVLCTKLAEEGFKIKGLDTDFYQGCNLFNCDNSIEHMFKDVRHITKEDLVGFDAIIHLAALSNDPIGALNPKLTYDINCKASIQLAKYAKEAGVRRFIFSSSCSIYGISSSEMIDEAGRLNPVTEYAKSKIKAEQEIAKYADSNFSPVFLRNSTVYGISPRHRVDLVVNNLVGWAYVTGKIRIMSDGTPWRPLIHLEDICQAFTVTLKAPKDLIHNQTFNVGSNNSNYQIKDIADVIQKVMPECNIEYTGEHGSDSRTYKVNFGKINRVLGDYFKPSWNIERGVREILKVYKANKLTKDDFDSDKFTRLKRINKLLENNKVDKKLFWIHG